MLSDGDINLTFFNPAWFHCCSHAVDSMRCLLEQLRDLLFSFCWELIRGNNVDLQRRFVGFTCIIFRDLSSGILHKEDFGNLSRSKQFPDMARDHAALLSLTWEFPSISIHNPRDCHVQLPVESLTRKLALWAELYCTMPFCTAPACREHHCLILHTCIMHDWHVLRSTLMASPVGMFSSCILTHGRVILCLNQLGGLQSICGMIRNI